MGKLAKSIMLLDRVSGEVRMIEDDRFDFNDTCTVVVLNELYAFKAGSPAVSAYKIADFTSSENLVKTTLPTLPRHEALYDFAVSYWGAAGSIVLTGGRDSDNKLSAQTFLLAVKTDQWEQRSFPDLNVARTYHASISLGKQCYVACGAGDDDSLRSVEMLRLGAQAWELINIPGLEPRYYPVFS